MAQNPRVDKWLDLVDRAGWTAVQAAAGAAIAAITVDMDWAQVGVTVGVATLVAVCKVLAGQQIGPDDTGSLIGRNVIEPPPKAEG